MFKVLVATALTAATLLVPAASAQAGVWYKAETDRFIVYGENFETRVHDYAVKLQTFDQVLRLFHPGSEKRVPDTKLQVVLVQEYADLKRVQPALPRNVGGFYNPNNEGVFAVGIMKVDGMGDDVLFHEYAHHFQRENLPVAAPGWFVEGFAEYFGPTQIAPGEVKVGGYNEGRAYVASRTDWIPLEDLITKRPWSFKDKVGNFYAQSWLLMHYMRSDKQRTAQLQKIVEDVAAGVEPVQAFERATGRTMAQLTADLKAYEKLRITTIKGEFVKPSAIVMSKMPPSAGDFLLGNIRLIYSEAGKVDKDFLADVRRKAQRWPDDPYAQMSLARAEFVMGDVAAGDAIMRKLSAQLPGDEEVQLLAGMGDYFAGLRDPAHKTERFRAARPRLMQAYKLNDRDFRPLYAYVETRTVEPNYPTDRDLEASEEARDLAPSVTDISLQLGKMLLRRDRKGDATVVLAPILNDPHGGGMARYARALLDGASEEEAEKLAKAEVKATEKP
jgi:hypothetical protein